MKLSAHDIRRLAVESHRDPRTVRAVIDGRPTRDLAKNDVEQAAVRLGIVLPGLARARRREDAPKAVAR